MPTFITEMFYPKGPMATDYTKIHEECKKIAKLINKANEVIITSPDGTNLNSPFMYLPGSTVSILLGK